LFLGVIIIGVNQQNIDVTQTSTGGGGTVPSSSDEIADSEAMKAAVKMRDVRFVIKTKNTKRYEKQIMYQIL